MRKDAVRLRTAALGARRAAVRLCVDARGLRRASLRARTDAPSIPTDALLIRGGTLVSNDGGPTNSKRRPGRSKGRSARKGQCPTRTLGRFARTSGCPRDSRGRRKKARTGFTKSHAILARFPRCPIHLGSRGADARSGPRHARRRFARTSGRRRWDSRRQTRRGRCATNRRRHPPSLQRFAREELAPSTKEGALSTDASLAATSARGRLAKTRGRFVEEPPFPRCDAPIRSRSS
jgi:hypothetical protein